MWRIYALRAGDVIADSLHVYWNVSDITCYDPGISDDETPLDRKYDGVVATNILDHLPEEDLPWVVDRLFEKADKFIYANMSEYPANAWLPNGENARITRKPADWWVQLFSKAAHKYPEIRFCLAFARRRTDHDGNAEVAMTHFHTCPDLELPSSFYLGRLSEGEGLSAP